MGVVAVCLLGLAALAIGGFLILLRVRFYDRWLGTYVWQAATRRSLQSRRPIHVLLCFADHYEPKAQRVSVAKGQARVDHWVDEYPKRFVRFTDSDGRTPRHTFFFPIEEYEPGYLDALRGPVPARFRRS